MKRLIVYFFIIAAEFFSASSVSGQSLPMLHYTMADGLPSNTIYSIYRDHKGFLWIATDKGVGRYNGVRFETFTTFDGLSDNEVFFFQEDPYGRLWLATYNGELCYYKDDTFHNEANTPFLKLPLKIAHIGYINVEKDSSVTMLFLNVNFFINIRNNRIDTFNLEKAFKIFGVNKFFLYLNKLSPNEYKILSNDFTLIIDTGMHIRNYEIRVYDPDLSVRQSQDIHYTFDRKFVSFNGDTIRFTNKNLIKGRITEFYNDGKHTYIITNSGIYTGDSLLIFKDNISSLNQDNKKNYWIGTLDNGVYVFNKNFNKTRLYEKAYDGKVTYANVSDNCILFSTNTNLYTLVNSTVKKILDYKKISKAFSISPCAPVFSFDEHKRFYGCLHKICIAIDSLPFKKPVINIYGRSSPEDYTYIYKSIVSTGVRLYMQLRTNITSLDIEKHGSVKERVFNSVNTSNENDRIFTMAKSENNEVWYSTIKKVYKIKNDQGEPQPQFKNASFKYFNFYGKYLIGYTHNNQLLVCHNIDGNVAIDSISFEKNCVWNKFYKINDSLILISTNDLYRVLNIHTATYEKRPSISIIENPFLPLQCEYVCADTANCYFFKNGSITAIDIKSFSEKPEPPKLSFTFLKTGKIHYRIPNEIEIPYRESKNISITFSALSYGDKNITYQYSVSKTDKDNWRDVKGEEINLGVNPGFGSYTIKVKAKTISSEYSEPTVFALHILRPYWATWWFILLCIFAGVSIIGIVIRYRFLYVVSKNKKAHDNEVKFMRSEFKSLNALMNPHFIFNTLNNVQSLFNGNDKLAANEYLRIFADLIRQNMYNVSKELITLQKEMALVMNYLMLEKLRFEDKLVYNINVDEDIDLSDIMIPPLLIQPLVENSIKHGILPLKNKQGIVEINVYERNGILSIEVRDNGPGMDHEKVEKKDLYESFGMISIKKRIEQLSIIQNKEIAFHTSEIKDETSKHLWTVVTISMPVSE